MTTFGYPTIGGTWNGSGTPYKFANRIGPIPAHKIYRLSLPEIYMQSNPSSSGGQSQTLRPVLWGDISGPLPGNILNLLSAVTYIGNLGGGGILANWQGFTFEGGASTLDIDNSASASDLYLWFGVFTTGSNNIIEIAGDTGAAGSNQFKMDAGYGSAADGQAFGTPDGNDNSKFSFQITYVDVTAAGVSASMEADIVSSFGPDAVVDHATSVAFAIQSGFGINIKKSVQDTRTAPILPPVRPTPIVPHFDLPFRLSGKSFAVVEQDSHEDVANCVETIIRTPYGFRDDAPDFGLDDHTFDNRPLNVDAMRAQIESQEPRATMALTEEPSLVEDIVTSVNATVN